MPRRRFIAAKLKKACRSRLARHQASDCPLRMSVRNLSQTLSGSDMVLGACLTPLWTLMVRPSGSLASARVLGSISPRGDVDAPEIAGVLVFGGDFLFGGDYAQLQPGCGRGGDGGEAVSAHGHDFIEAVTPRRAGR